jgi:hypothetical protein
LSEAIVLHEYDAAAILLRALALATDDSAGGHRADSTLHQ